MDIYYDNINVLQSVILAIHHQEVVQLHQVKEEAKLNLLNELGEYTNYYILIIFYLDLDIFNS